MDAICFSSGHRPFAWRGWTLGERAAVLAIDNIRMALPPERRRPVRADDEARRPESHELARILPTPLTRADLHGFGVDFLTVQKQNPTTSPGDLMAIFPDMTAAEAAEWAGAGRGR